jgi:bifunctional ADP-heptose synthase (sugar kinase/adenylyltransferase)
VRIRKITGQEVRMVLDRICDASVAVIGDFGLDAYWFLDERPGEQSCETGRTARSVREQRYGLAGAGNVVANLAALGIAKIRAIGVVGDDMFGRELLRRMEGMGTDVSGIVVQREGWQTQVYGKPFLHGLEQERTDFGSSNRVTEVTARKIRTIIDETAAGISTFICNQQREEGVLNRPMVEKIAEMIPRNPSLRFIVDSRHFARRFDGAILKMNFKEARYYLGRRFGSSEEINLEDAGEMAAEISAVTANCVYVTCGPAGLVIFDRSEATAFEAHHLPGPVDEVGAGDTACAMIASSLDTGADPILAAGCANVAAAVCVAKLFQTGAATREEILGIIDP